MQPKLSDVISTEVKKILITVQPINKYLVKHLFKAKRSNLISQSFVLTIVLNA